MVENLAITHPAPRRHVRAFLTEPEPMTEAAAAKDEIIARTRNFKTRAFDHLPSQTSSDDELEVPASDQPASRAVYRDDLSPARGVAFGDGDRNEPRADIRALVALQCLGELIGGDLLCPAAMRRRRAEIVAHAAKGGRGQRSPQPLYVFSHPTPPRRALH